MAVAAQAALVSASLVLAGGAVLTVFMAGEPRGSVWSGLALSAVLATCMFLVAFLVFAALKAGGPTPLGRSAKLAPFVGAALIGALPFAIAAGDPDTPTAAAIVAVATLASLGGALFWKSDLARRTLPPIGVALALAGLVFAWSWTKPDTAELAQFREDLRRAGFANCIDS